MNLLDKPPVLILIVVFLLIIVRQVGRFRLQIWQIMTAGALSVILLGSITPKSALAAINVDVMLFLFGMFVVGEALHRSGYLYQLSDRLFRTARTVDQLILRILLAMGLLSAVLMNDTLAIICTPLMLYFARRHSISPKLLLLTLAIAITTGSVLSPIGNPQNLLIAVDGKIPNAFVMFLVYLATPTIAGMLMAFFVLKLFYRSEFHTVKLEHALEQVTDPQLAKLSQLSLWIIAALITLRIISSFVRVVPDFSLTWIAMLSAAPILLLSRNRYKVLRRIDWATLLFFASMFVLMEAVWRTGTVQSMLSYAGWNVGSLSSILGISVVVSQLVSNVPFVALYLPVLQHTGDPILAKMALAAGSTIAGNLLIMGAASNIIIIQNAERQGETISFWEFARVGIPLTLAQTICYWLYLMLF